MKAYVVVEGTQDVAILRAVLHPRLLENADLVVGGGRSNLASRARSLLVTRRRPVVIVEDADAIDEAIMQEEKRSKEELLSTVSAGIPTKVIMIRPSIEVLLFQIPGFVNRVFKVETSSSLASINPKKALLDLLESGSGPRNLGGVLDHLTEDDAAVLRSSGPICELTEFLEQVSAASQPTLV